MGGWKSDVWNLHWPRRGYRATHPEFYKRIENAQEKIYAHKKGLLEEIKKHFDQEELWKSLTDLTAFMI